MARSHLYQAVQQYDSTSVGWSILSEVWRNDLHGLVVKVGQRCYDAASEECTKWVAGCSDAAGVGQETLNADDIAGSLAVCNYVAHGWCEREWMSTQTHGPLLP